MNIIIINGPNLNLLGKREPSIYGSQSFEEYLVKLKEEYPSVNISYYQSNVEGELIDIIQDISVEWQKFLLKICLKTIPKKLCC